METNNEVTSHAHYAQTGLVRHFSISTLEDETFMLPQNSGNNHLVTCHKTGITLEQNLFSRKLLW
jgi:hypothetical protein